MLEAGEEVISSRLAARSTELAGIISAKFQHSSLEQIAAEFEAALDSNGETVLREAS